MKKQSDYKLLSFMLRAKIVADSQNKEGGYAMLVVSIVTIIIFSLLSAYLFVTQQNTSITSSYIDGANTFYAAESGLNKRADDIRKKFIGYQTPQGLSPGQASTSSTVTPANISNCFTIAVGTALGLGNDFDCQNYQSTYVETSGVGSQVNKGRDSLGGNSSIENTNKNINYQAYTFVADTTNYGTSNTGSPIPTIIPNDEQFGGLSAIEYKYTVYSSAAKKTSSTSMPTLDGGLAQSILQMDFKSRVIPLFQFGVLYERDLETTATYDFALSGRVHTNGNLYVQATSLPLGNLNPNGKTDFLNNVTVVGDVYNTVWSANTPRYGDVRFRDPITLLYSTLPYGSITRITPLTPLELSPFAPQLQSNVDGVRSLTLPDAGFLRKRNYKTDKIGTYFSKADIRIEMVPDRAVPFDVTVIQSGTGAIGGACTTTLPSPNTDPNNLYIDPTRNQATTAQCSRLSTGKLLSLQQPIMVMAKGSAEEEERFCKRTPIPVIPTGTETGAVIDRTRDLIGYQAITTEPIMDALSNTQKDEVLKALQIAILSSATPIDYNNVIKQTGALPGSIQSTFRTMLNSVSGPFPGTDRNTIGNIAPARLAKSRKSCFLSAPIQMVKNQSNQDSFVERREIINSRKILQTNIESLTVWNRDGRYMEYPDTPTISPSDLTSLSNLVPVFSSADYTGPYATAGLLFKRSVANLSANYGSFDKLGLGASDTTEGGLVLYETVNDNLNGDGVINPANDVTASSTNPILKTDAAGNPSLDNSGLNTVLDYYRNYKNSGVFRHSIYGFAITGGNNLPGALSVVTDQSLYVQGDYNNYPLSKKPAALMADAISTLSVNCISRDTNSDLLGVRTGIINCGIPTSLTGSDQWTGAAVNTALGVMYTAADTTYNTALLSSTNSSLGNYGVGRGGGGVLQDGGAVNLYTRLIENWTSKQQTLLGSIVNLSITIENKEPKKLCGTIGAYCNSPLRSFSFDTDFNDFNKLPPLTPQAVYLQQAVYSRK